MCLIVKRGYSTAPIPVVKGSKWLERRGNNTYKSPYFNYKVPRSGYMAPQEPKYHGSALTDESSWHRPSGIKHIFVVRGGLIHSYAVPSRRRAKKLFNFSRASVYGSSCYFPAYALGVEFVGDMYIASRGLYIPDVDSYHDELDKEEFCKFLDSLNRVRTLTQEEQDTIVNYVNCVE